jgi:hypothetical protein
MRTVRETYTKPIAALVVMWAYQRREVDDRVREGRDGGKMGVRIERN